MLTLSILWVVLAGAVTLMATMKKAPARLQETGGQAPESGKALTLLAVVYGLILLAGFVYVSRFLVSTLL